MKKTTIDTPVPKLIGDIGMELVTGEPQGYVPTGIRPLDDIIVGIVNAEVTMIAAKPSQGKTALAMQILENAASAGVLSAVISMEMSDKALSQRMIASRTGIPTRVLRTRTWTAAQKRDAIAAAKALNSLPLYVDDRSYLTGQHIYETIRVFKEMGIGLVAIDYLQLMTGENESRQVQVGDAAKQVKAGAKDFNMPVILLSQLNRASDAREDKKPRMSDLRDSGEIEQVADTIIMFHYPEDDLMEDIRTVDFHVVKQRNGPTGVASMLFNKPLTRFQEVK